MTVERLSPKLAIVTEQWGGPDHPTHPTRRVHEHWCPGCNAVHQIAVEQPFRNGHCWTWDGDAEAPTFSPSVNIAWAYGDPNRRAERCHYFIRAGRIEFCGDSMHALAGQTVPLPDFPEGEP